MAKFRDKTDDDFLIDGILLCGYFTAEDATHLYFQEIEYEGEPFTKYDLWKINKKSIRYEPLLNIRGNLEFDSSYYPELIDNQWHILGGERLMFFAHNPFILEEGTVIPTNRPKIWN